MSEYKIPCQVIQDLMPLYADGLTTEITDGHIQEHLHTCADCKEKYEMIKQSISANEGEKKIEEQKEIDYLKKVKKSSRKKLLIGFLSAVLIIIIAATLKLYIIGFPTDSYTVTNMNIDLSDPVRRTMIIEGALDSSKNAYCRYKLTTKNDGTQKVIIYGCLSSPWKKESDFKIKLVLDSIDDKVDIHGATINKHGLLASSLANELSEAWHPYVGDMSSNERIAQILKIRDVFGDYESTLQTEKAPYSWTLKFKNKVPNPELFDKKMEAYACLMMASIGNLDKVAWTYAENVTGSKQMHRASLTREEGSKLVNQDISNLHSPSVMQIFVDYLNFLNYTTKY